MNPLRVLLRGLRVALMSDDDDIPDIPPAELDMALDEDNKAQGKGPVPRAPDKGIINMLDRIKYLTQQRENLIAKWQEITSEGDAIAKATLNRIDADLREARERLTEYETQLKGRN